MLGEEKSVPVRRESGTPAPASGPSNPFSALRSEIDRVFDDFFPGFPRLSFFERPPAFWSRPTGALVPKVDVSETDRTFEISAELPGLSEKDIEVSVAEGVLTLKGERKEEREEKDKNYHLVERSYGSFQRSFSLPEGVDADKIAATYEKGVLNITLPKMPEAQIKRRKIAVEAKKN
jgi:HSP20 family protein